jgi:antitoxin component of MazEF toxin-antitoxin module
LVEATGVKAGDEVKLKWAGGILTAERSPIRRIPLKELLREIKPEQLHGEWDVGPPVGNEVW